MGKNCKGERKGIMNSSFLQKNVNIVVIFAVIAASFSPIFTKLTGAPPIAIGFYRLSIAMPIFAVISFSKYRSALKAVTVAQLLGAALAGVLLAGHFFSWFTSLRHTSVASASVLSMTHPIMVLFISVFLLKKRTNAKAIAGVLLAFVGSIIISGNDYALSQEALLGDLMAVLSALFLGLYYLAGNKYRKNINASIYVFLVFFFCWLSFLVCMLATKTPFLGYTKSDYFWIFVMAIVCQIGAHAVFNWCLAYTSALYISTLENLETFISTAFAALIFAEIPTAVQILGASIIVVGVIYYSKNEENRDV